MSVPQSDIGDFTRGDCDPIPLKPEDKDEHWTQEIWGQKCSCCTELADVLIDGKFYCKSHVKRAVLPPIHRMRDGFAAASRLVDTVLPNELKGLYLTAQRLN